MFPTKSSASLLPSTVSSCYNNNNNNISSSSSSSARRTHEEDIYEDLCYVTLRVGGGVGGDRNYHILSSSSASSSGCPKDGDNIGGGSVGGIGGSSACYFNGASPLEKRDYCIRELIETEKNYIDALNMIIKHFSRPLTKILQPKHRSIIFNHIQELVDLHTSFHRDLCCASAGGISGLRISTCFFNWKDKFVIYGDYCANLPRAQSMIDELCAKSETIAASITQSQIEANDGKFKLRDLLSLPMQRILKYHLLLKELIKNTSESHDDYPGLQRAYQAMRHIGEYINEVKRDSETLQIIQGIQESIFDLEMPGDTELKDYGRLVKDGEVKMRSQDDKNLKSRYIFVFDKVILMCKSLKNGQYSFKSALILNDFQVEDTPPVGISTIKHFKEKLSHQWFLVNTQDRSTYTFFVKSDEQKRKWIEAVQKALDNVNPEPVRNGNTDHAFIMNTFKTPQTCGFCDKFLCGLFFQGYRCTICDVAVHKNCILSVRPCGAPSLPPRFPLPSSSPSVISGCGEDDAFTISSSSDVFSTKNGILNLGLDSPNGEISSVQDLTKVRTILPFKGNPERGEICFEVDDIIAVTNTKPSNVPSDPSNSPWFFGENQRTGKESLFPAKLVQISSKLPNNSYHSNLIHHPYSHQSGLPVSHYHQRSSSIGDVETGRSTYTPASVSRLAFMYDLSGCNDQDHKDIVYSNYVNLNLQAYPWFAGSMDRTIAENVLEKLPSSTFLVRISPNQKGVFAISLNCNGVVQHMKICKSDNKFYLSRSKYFNTIVELVKWYSERTLADSFTGLNCTLGIPYQEGLKLISSSDSFIFANTLIENSRAPSNRYLHRKTLSSSSFTSPSPSIAPSTSNSTHNAPSFPLPAWSSSSLNLD
ncbi:guanine nucleotide exchange factor VAV2-like [Brevipalpus obovatus]|uniref:guanine nucleotide exchange factor VAV2-like n=1 Tax=Brevipalpus obovatus TaxID=246614 RepID=UPI003D9E1F1B